MKKLEDKIRERFKNCPGVKKVEFQTELKVDVVISKKSQLEIHRALADAEWEIRGKYPGMSIDFRYIIDNLNKKGEEL